MSSDHPGHDPICSPNFKEGQGGRQISVAGFIESEVENNKYLQFVHKTLCPKIFGIFNNKQDKPLYHKNIAREVQNS